VPRQSNRVAASHVRPAPGRECIAACTKGLEDVLAGELTALGAREVSAGRGSVTFVADLETFYRTALHLRTAVRVLVPVCDGEVRSPEDLYDLVASVDWSRYTSVDRTLAVECNVKDSAITHSGYAALKVKDAVVDQFRDNTGERPNIDRENADLRLALRVFRDHATLSLDATGDSLHKRGWRPIQVKSPLNEAIAAGIVLLSGWDRSSVLVDPMCGSGTLPVEAALIASDTAPGLLRDEFAFHRWPDFDSALWNRVKDEARARVKPVPAGLIFGNDLHGGALDLARKGAKAAGVDGSVTLFNKDISEWQPPAPPKVVVVNPPYGERLGDADDLPALYKSLGSFLKKQCQGASAFVLSGNPEITRHIGLKAMRKHVLFNGPIECRLLRYDIY